MLTFILYAIIGGFAGWIFKFIAGLIEGFFTFLVFGVLTGFKGDFSDRIQSKPKRFLFSLLTKNVIIGSLNAIMIFIVTTNFMLKYDVNYWVYVIASIFWSFLIIGYTPVFAGMYFMTSTVSLIFMWLGLSILAPLIIAPLTFIVSLAYYYGRVNAIIEQERERNGISA